MLRPGNATLGSRRLLLRATMVMALAGVFVSQAGAETCCEGRVGDANGLGGDEPTIGDVSVMIDAKFIKGYCEGVLDCLAEADINQSGGCNPTCDDITIVDIVILLEPPRDPVGTRLLPCLECCCEGRVGDIDGSGDDEPTINDISLILNHYFGGPWWDLVDCMSEADVNQSGGCNPTHDDVTIGDRSVLIDYLYITGPRLGLYECLVCY